MLKKQFNFGRIIFPSPTFTYHFLRPLNGRDLNSLEMWLLFLSFFFSFFTFHISFLLLLLFFVAAVFVVFLSVNLFYLPLWERSVLTTILITNILLIFCAFTFCWGFILVNKNFNHSLPLFYTHTHTLYIYIYIWR